MGYYWLGALMLTLKMSVQLAHLIPLGNNFSKKSMIDLEALEQQINDLDGNRLEY